MRVVCTAFRLRTLFATALLVTVGAVWPNADLRATTPVTLDLRRDGSLITAPAANGAVYVLAGGRRYVFPNEPTYRTWYGDFSTVHVLANAEMWSVPLASGSSGLVTYRPGARLVKVASDPKVYAVARGGVLRHVTAEALARLLYGSDWNRNIDDIPDAFFTAYTIGTPITDASQYDSALEAHLATSILYDKGLSTVQYVSGDALVRELCPGGTQRCDAPAALKTQFGCDVLSEVRNFRPKVLMAECGIHQNRGSNPRAVVFQHGGLLGSATNFLIRDRGDLRLIDTMSAFRAMFTPIANADDAMNFTLATTTAERIVSERELLGNPSTLRSVTWRVPRASVRYSYAEWIAEGAYDVLLFARTPFPCPVDSITEQRYRVTRDGAIDRLASRLVVDVDRGFCVD